MEENRLEKLIKEKNYLELKKELDVMNSIDVAEILEEFDLHTLLLVFRMLSKDLAVDVFANFSTGKQKEIIGLITDKELQDIIDELYFDDMIDIIEEIPANIVKKILENSREDERNLINQFLRYPPESAGSIMTIEYVELKKTMTVKDALDHIKDIGLDRETVYTCYVTNANRKLEGIVSLRKLVISSENKTIEKIMNADVIYVHTHDDQEEVADLFIKYGFIALPVVDNEDRLTGIITVDDIMDVIEDEATEDFQRMAAISPSEDGYLDTGVLTLAKRRFPWLLILMVSATFTGRIMLKFENILSSVVLLTTFIPMLMDTGGNSGNQSSTLIIRGLATGELSISDWYKVLWKELRISILVGLSLSVVNFIRLILIEKVSLIIAFVVSLTIIVTVISAKLVGGLLPIIAKKIGLDPAIMAGPLITTIVDALSLIVYFGMASALLGL